MVINKDEILADFIKAFSSLENTIELFDDKDFNKVPFAGSWTAGQVAQHILLSDEGFVEVLNDKVAITERAVDEFKPQLKAIFLNFETKMKSPDFVLPELKDYDKEAHLLKVVKIKDGMAKAINDLDLGKTCSSFSLPGLGYLTRYEAIYFVIYHTTRHAHQLNEIHRFLKEA